MFYFFISLRRFYLPRGNQRTIGPENAHLKPDLVTIITATAVCMVKYYGVMLVRKLAGDWICFC